MNTVTLIVLAALAIGGYRYYESHEKQKTQSAAAGSFVEVPPIQGDNGTLPVVFVNGRGKSNPTLGEVLAEYKGK